MGLPSDSANAGQGPLLADWLAWIRYGIRLFHGNYEKGFRVPVLPSFLEVVALKADRVTWTWNPRNIKEIWVPTYRAMEVKIAVLFGPSSSDAYSQTEHCR